MAIKYLDAKRIRGANVASHTDPVVIGGTSSGTGGNVWADGTQDGSDHTVWYDIRRGTTVGEANHQSGTGVTGLANATTNGGDGFVDHPDTTNPSQGSDSQWGIRFKLTIDSITTNSSSTVKVGIGMSSSNGDGGGGHEGSVVMKFNNSTRKFMCTGSKSGGDTDDTSKTKEIGTNMMATGTWYCTVWQLPVTSYTRIRASVTTNSDYETGATTSAYTQDNDNWGNEDANFVKYFRIFNSKDGSTSIDNHVYFKVEDMKLWNGTNDFDTTPTTTIDMAHSTGVSGTGIRSRYTKYSERNPLIIREDLNWGNNGTKIIHTPAAVDEKTTLVTAAPWTKEGTQTNVTGGLVEVRNVAQNTSGVSYPLGLTVDGDFVLRFKYKQNAASGGNGDVVGLTSGSIHHTSQEVIDLILFNGYFYLIAKTGGSVIQSSGGQSNGSDQDTDMNPVDGTQYYGELKRSGNVYTATVRTGSHSGSVFERVLTFTKTSGNHATPNRIFIGAQRDSQAKSIDVDDIEFWDDTDSTSGSATYTQDFSTAVDTPTSDLPENTLFEETDTYLQYWLQSSAWQPINASRGLFGGGGSGNIIDYITITTLGNAIDFGDLTTSRNGLAGCASDTRGVFAGGETSGSYSNVIDYVTVASLGDATDFGNLTVARQKLAGCSNRTRGVFGGGYSGSTDDEIDYITIATTGNATDFGNLTTSREQLGSCGNYTRGLWAGGGSSDVIDYITIATAGNATDFGDLVATRSLLSGLASETRGVFGGGSSSNVMEYVTISTTGDASDFGDLTVARGYLAGLASRTRGIFGGGNASGTTIDYITIATLGNATDFGDLTADRNPLAGLSA